MEASRRPAKCNVQIAFSGGKKKKEGDVAGGVPCRHAVPPRFRHVPRRHTWSMCSRKQAARPQGKTCQAVMSFQQHLPTRDVMQTTCGHPRAQHTFLLALRCLRINTDLFRKPTGQPASRNIKTVKMHSVTRTTSGLHFSISAPLHRIDKRIADSESQ